MASLQDPSYHGYCWSFGSNIAHVQSVVTVHNIQSLLIVPSHVQYVHVVHVCIITQSVDRPPTITTISVSVCTLPPFMDDWPIFKEHKLRLS